MQTKTFQAFTPQELKTQIDLIIAADSPTFIFWSEMICARGSFVVVWS